MNVQHILTSMRADCVPAGKAGRWTVSKRVLTPAKSKLMDHMAKVGKCHAVPPGNYTHLHCLTMATMMNPPGETVMNDFPCELRKHLEFIRVARGRVLVGGLGLGCVVRGLLAYGKVDAVDIVERSEDVIKLCGDSVQDSRVAIHHRDALHGFVRGGPWDYAWWDLWSDPEKDEPHLQVIHMKLIANFMDRVKHRQGAWAMPRKNSRVLREHGVVI
jgi:hypothetical protein